MPWSTFIVCHTHRVSPHPRLYKVGGTLLSGKKTGSGRLSDLLEVTQHIPKLLTESQTQSPL